jgi:hypothetical protein
MAKREVSPDRRGMGAQSDFIGETFVPSDAYKAQQAAMAQRLIQAGVDPDEVAKMFLVQVEVDAEENKGQ